MIDREWDRRHSILAHRFGAARANIRIAIENADLGLEWVVDYLRDALERLDSDEAERYYDAIEAKVKAS